MDVELKKMEKKWDEVYEQTHNQEVMQPQEVAVVAEKEYEYGADAFEEYLKNQKTETKPSDIIEAIR